MNLSFEIVNEEDIHYLSNISDNEKERLLRTAISIGFKSIQMSEVNMDCHSYIDPIKGIINDATSENKNKINEIDDKLDALLNIRTNSSRKGKLSEELCYYRLMMNYPGWEFIDVSQQGHEGDCRAKHTPIGDILYEFKSYDTNVNREQIHKFYNDLETTGVKYGIFVSNTSGIVGKKNLEWEIIQGDKLVIYISNVGLNGQGCVLATELLIAMVKNNIMESDKLWLLQRDDRVEEYYQNIVHLFEDYRRDNEALTKYRKHLKEYRGRMNVMIDQLEREIFQIVLDSENTFHKMMGIVEKIKDRSIVTESFDIEEFITKNNYSKKHNDLFRKLYKLIVVIEGITIKLNENEIIMIKDDKIMAKTKTIKTRIQLIFYYGKEELRLNPIYEEYRDKQLIITIMDEINLWEIIQRRLS